MVQSEGMEVLRTGRLRLRRFELADAPFVLDLINEEGWRHNISDPGVRDLEQARSWMRDRLLAPYQRLGHGFWAVEALEGGALLGLCGLYKRDALPHPDLGYAFAARHQGLGYAREAARACLAHGHEVLAMPVIQAITAAHNAKSARLLADLGMRDCGLQSLSGYAQPQRQFESRRAAA